MLTNELMKNNQASWADIRCFIDDFPEGATWTDWKIFMRSTISAAVDGGWDKYFRAGQSMQHIIFSTCESHGLERFDPQPPRVTLYRDKNEYFVAWSDRNLWFAEPGRQDRVTRENVLSTLRTFLTALWEETRPTEGSLTLQLHSDDERV